MCIALLVFLAPISYFAWAAIHELSHLAVVRGLRPLRDVRIRTYPHIDPVLGFVWASVIWTSDGEPLKPEEDAFVSVAPRLADFIAVVVTPIGAWLLPTGCASWAWVVFFAGGVVDLAVGSIGMNAMSDLRRVAMGWRLNVWILRVVGWSLVAVTTTITVVGLVS